jgi:hypothetical protein
VPDRGREPLHLLLLAGHPADVFRFIEVEYNRTRLRKHPEFGYLTPLETRARLQQGFTPAA